MAKQDLVMQMVRIAGILGALFLGAVAPVQADSSKERIVGKWWAYTGAAEGDKITMEFGPDGTYNVTVGGQTNKGSYRFVNDTTLETKIGDSVSQFTAAVATDDLALSQGAEKASFQRVKQQAAEPAENKS